MWGLTLILLLLPLCAQASCTDNYDPSYNLAVSQGNYDKAFQGVAQELHLSAEDQRHFQIIQGFSRAHDDRHGQADPDTLDLHLDPGLFIEGKEGACQGVVHELTHLHQFQRDRRRLHDYVTKHPSPNAGQAEDDAYDRLQDNDLVPHAAAADIEAVLAQIPYASGHVLRDEDLSYLVENLAAWASHQSMISDYSNQSYYLPEIKRQDVRLFCHGFDYARQRHANTAPAVGAWQYFCRH
jgi:hypothetical protein